MRRPGWGVLPLVVVLLAIGGTGAAGAEPPALVANPTIKPATAAPSDCSRERRGGFVGVGGTESFNHPDDVQCILALQALSGVGVLRQTFEWSEIERSPGRYEFRAYDWWVRAVAEKGMRALALLFGNPQFHVRLSDPWAFPPPPEAFAGFAAAVARRYGPDGSFWRENPSIAKVPIRSWQIWNEPNLNAYWYPRPSAREYIRLLVAAARAIKAVDAGAEIVTAGLPDSRLENGVPFRRFLTAMYRAGGTHAFDTLALNAYSRRAANVTRFVREARTLMDELGDRRGRIWVTEAGWASGGPRTRFTVGQLEQAKQLALLLRSLHRARRGLRLRGVIHFAWQDGLPYAPLFRDQWGLHTGLFTVDGRPKPAYRRFAQVAKRLR